MEKYSLLNTLAQFLVIDEFVKRAEITKVLSPKTTVGELVDKLERDLESPISLYLPGLTIAKLFFVFVCTQENSVFEEIKTKKCSEIGVTGDYADKEIDYFVRKMRNAVSHYHIEMDKCGKIKFYDGYFKEDNKKSFVCNFTYVCTYEELYKVSYNLLEYCTQFYAKNKNIIENK
ncbi:MAG: hypothetical protein IKK85_06315 [Clostridia bacterium]|nr:hypothetical protein [Clostridia bacterium]